MGGRWPTFCSPREFARFCFGGQRVRAPAGASSAHDGRDDRLHVFEVDRLVDVRQELGSKCLFHILGAAVARGSNRR